MKQYKIFTHPTQAMEAVKQGWSWPGFFFSFIWALVKKQWVLGFGVLIGIVGLGYLVDAFIQDTDLGERMINLFALAINFVFGMKGNSFREGNLISRGYQLVNTVAAKNPKGAMIAHVNAESTMS
ncbi:MAG: DUF2628 domain-containing protein [Desulfomicrobium sp.]|nr:DUF2628 domain-containing protein [Desulfomicrobium sp.]NLV97114.1 DUF2628 domain-containing protein [Desulfovibrionales bacterium]